VRPADDLHGVGDVAPLIRVLRFAAASQAWPVRRPSRSQQSRASRSILPRDGEAEDANEWRHIADAMKIIRGPHQS